ncbi:tumor necrosis factor receptor superfamily member 1A isoform X2 [Sardina pilchardus]|uniref:tumor necrosis factor receptor superfamily member 1A isoform X2 n=1 Tax=Sardina pilchardus TaxID=27697 RepID=UPI002E0DD74B
MGRGRQLSTWTNNVGLSFLIFELLVLQSHAVWGVDTAAGPWPSPSPAKSTTSSRHDKCQLDHQYPHSSNKFCCNKCIPGFVQHKECSGEGRTTECKPCRNGTYMDVANYYANCFRCRKCKVTEVEITKCNYKTNTVCQCKPGYYKKNIIPELDHECRRCKKCGDGEIETSPCTPEQDRKCECKYLHYREKIDDTFCKLCSDEDDCPGVLVKPSTDPGPGNPELPMLVTVPLTIIATVLLTALVMLSYKAIKRRVKQEKRSPATSEPPDSPSVSLTSSEPLLTVTSSVATIKNDHNEGIPFPCQASSETQNALPDCVPREIKTGKFIYSVLDLVPVSRVTELVRLLGVKDQDIERARRDNPLSCHEAQYHMLKRWADSGTRGHTATLAWPLLLQLLATLRDMGLGGCAESLEIEYGLNQACLNMA